MFNKDILMTALSGVMCMVCILQGQKTASTFMWVWMLALAVLNGYNFFFVYQSCLRGCDDGDSGIDRRAV